MAGFTSNPIAPSLPYPTGDQFPHPNTQQPHYPPFNTQQPHYPSPYPNTQQPSYTNTQPQVFHPSPYSTQSGDLPYPPNPQSQLPINTNPQNNPVYPPNPVQHGPIPPYPQPETHCEYIHQQPPTGETNYQGYNPQQQPNAQYHPQQQYPPQQEYSGPYPDYSDHFNNDRKSASPLEGKRIDDVTRFAKTALGSGLLGYKGQKAGAALGVVTGKSSEKKGGLMGSVAASGLMGHKTKQAASAMGVGRPKEHSHGLSPRSILGSGLLGSKGIVAGAALDLVRGKK